jgi:AraC-like DNA-binding protein
LYRDLRHEFTKKKQGYKDRIYIYLLSWLARFSQSYGNNENIAAPRDDQRAQTVSKISSYLEKNYTKQILLEEISDKLYLSKYYLCRIFKEYTGFTITEYVNILRIKKATNLLENSDKSILEIADLLGFESMTYFERVFKKFMNITPLKYKKSHHSVTYGQKELNTIDDSDYI